MTLRLTPNRHTVEHQNSTISIVTGHRCHPWSHSMLCWQCLHQKMAILYILMLKDDCFYVGTTLSPIINCFQFHLAGFASKWTRIHKPLKLLKQIDCIDGINLKLQENMLVKQMMLEHGIDYVRGGSYKKCQLSVNEIHALRKELWYARSCCTRCGSHSHVNHCRARKDVNGLFISGTNEDCDDDEDVPASIDVNRSESDMESMGTSFHELNTDGAGTVSLMKEYCIVSEALLGSNYTDKGIKDCVRATKTLIGAILTKQCKLPGEELRQSSLQALDQSPSSPSPQRTHFKPTSRMTLSTDAHTKVSISTASFDSEESLAGHKGQINSNNHFHTVKRTIVIKRKSVNKNTSLPIIKTKHPIPTLTGIGSCTRCGRNGHAFSRCEEVKDKYGFDLSDFSF